MTEVWYTFCEKGWMCICAKARICDLSTGVTSRASMKASSYPPSVPQIFQGIADVVETLLEEVDYYLDEASGKGANQQVNSTVGIRSARVRHHCTVTVAPS